MYVRAFRSSLLAQFESMPGGRPKKARDKKTKDQIVKLFEKRLAPSKGGAVRRASLFSYPIGSETVHKTKLLKQLPLVYGLCALTKRKLSGPTQVKALMEWNNTHHYVPHHGSKPWAETEIQMLYNLSLIHIFEPTRPY